MSSIILIYVFVIGAVIGSFLNVVIYRYPLILDQEWKKECRDTLNIASPTTESFNLSKPRSHCPHCKNPIPWYHNIPILGYLWLCGKCDFCNKKISMQYLFVECLSAILSVLIVIHFGITPTAVALMIFTWLLITTSYIDYHHQFLPDTITYILLWLGLAASTQHLFISMKESILSAITGYLFLWFIAKMYLLLRKKEGLGLGDCKLFAALGAWTGFSGLISILFFASLLGIIVSGILLLTKKIDTQKLIPFGPFLSTIGWIVAVYGQSFYHWTGFLLS